MIINKNIFRGLVILTILLISSCAENAKETKPTDVKIEQRTSINPEMWPHIMYGVEFFEKWKANDGVNFNILYDGLNKHNRAFIESCTMRGEAHDLLHAWLDPHLKLINELKSDSADDAIHKIQASFDDFFQRFDIND
ncbi:MAG: hypothetical protein JJU02_13450 [Cryomorphaceae bacterium]|nr:hypothetical protein [Cryomorphaceae bacterium]